MGTLEASNDTISGEMCPEGAARKMVCASAVICAIAISIFTFGWKYIRMTATPL